MSKLLQGDYFKLKDPKSEKLWYYCLDNNPNVQAPDLIGRFGLCGIITASANGHVTGHRKTISYEFEKPSEIWIREKSEKQKQVDAQLELLNQKGEKKLPKG